MRTLDTRIDELLGEEPEAACPVFLEMGEETAGVVVEALRWTLYGGTQPVGGRKALLLVLDALTVALSGRSAGP